MIKIRAYCLLQGPNFSPALAESRTCLSFENKNEVGEAGRSGRYKDIPIPYGSAELTASDTDRIIRILETHIGTFRSCHAETIILHLDVSYDAQCNLEFSPELIKKISDLQIPFTISCYADDEEWQDCTNHTRSSQITQRCLRPEN
ncbi:hypothetical protein [Desulfonema ishimotonii]|uniref:hypothetical protein n=1 Tax=Desulfonema ishimotonii TaxID=45657 RepID=UPI000F589024|nr:hypothetical protein [Desulfonema ishimotonii]